MGTSVRHIKPCTSKLPLLLITVVIVLFGSCKKMPGDENTVLYSVSKNGLWGFIDESGNVVVNPAYLSVNAFSEGLSVVVIDTIYKTIQTDTTVSFNGNQLVLSPKHERYLYVKYGYINPNGDYVIPPTLITRFKLADSIQHIDYIPSLHDFSFRNGLAVCMDSTNKFGYLNKEGKIVIPCKYKDASRFSEGKARVSICFPKDSLTLPTKKQNGEIDNTERVEQEHLRRLNNSGLIDLDGNPITDFCYVDIEEYNCNRSLAVIELEDFKYEDDGRITYPKFKMVLLDGNGHEIENVGFAGLGYIGRKYSDDGIARLESRWLISDVFGWQFVDTNGEILSPTTAMERDEWEPLMAEPTFRGFLPEVTIVDCTPFEEGLAAITTDRRHWVFIDKHFAVMGKNDEDCIYEDANVFREGLAPVKKDGKWGYIDKRFNVVIPYKYDYARCFNGKLAVVSNTDYKRTTLSYINKNGFVVWQEISHEGEAVENIYSRKSPELYGLWFVDTPKKSNEYIIVLVCFGALVILTLVFFLFKFIQKRRAILRQKREDEARKREEAIRQEKEKLLEEQRRAREAAERERKIREENERKQKEAERQRVEEQRRKEEERINEIIANIPSDLTEISSLVEENKVDEVESRFSEMEKVIHLATQEEKREFEKIKVEYGKKKEIGIPQGQKECYVNYNIPNIKTDAGYYAVVRTPQKGCIVWPYRRRTIARRGYMEQSFEEELRRLLNPKVKVLGDVNLLPQNGVRPFEPDIALVYSENGLNVRIDVEIDEPYAAVTNKPTHYIGCGDEYRDANLNCLGWIVVRFSEKQVKLQPKQCVKFISDILLGIDNALSIRDEIKNAPSLTREKQWTIAEAQKMASERVRQTYLNHEFGRTEESSYSVKDIRLTDFEESIKDKVHHIIIVPNSQSNVSASEEDYVSNNCLGYNKSNSFEQDKHISFDGTHHIYTVDGIQYKAVSNVISELFPVFDTAYWSTRKGIERGVNPKQVAAEWDAKGQESREVGTFMHQQIENYFLDQPIKFVYPFRYNGQFVHESKDIDIHPEIGFFHHFLKDVPIVPFRTEWRVFDRSLRIAGTIDLICKNGDCYDIYDWKRSAKLHENKVYGYGLWELSHLEDLPINHYKLQQNLYRYILEHQYGLKVRSMNLVVLHPDNHPDYEIIAVERMDNEIQKIIRML